MKGLSKKEKGLDMDNSVVIGRGKGCQGINGNGKKYNEILKNEIKITGAVLQVHL